MRNIQSCHQNNIKKHDAVVMAIAWRLENLLKWR